MEDFDSYHSVLGVFAHYGYRKASMADLAGAIGVTRQTLYNRFKNKEAVLDWAIEGFIGHKRVQATAELTNPDISVETCMLNAFSRWAGDGIPLIHGSPHGMEIMDLGLAACRRVEVDHLAAFEHTLADFLMSRGVCQDQAVAADLTFVLMMSSKGLMVKSLTTEEFDDGMKRIVHAVTRNNAS